MLWPKLARALFAKPLTDNAPLVPHETIQALGERLAVTSRARASFGHSITNPPRYRNN